MGTRATIKFKVGEKILLTIYHQYDGYIKNGIGNELGNYLNNFKIVNGFSFDATLNREANGFGCLIAQFVKEFKEEVGNLYIKSDDIENEDYNYVVNFNEEKWYKGVIDPNELINITVTIFDNKEPIFNGTPKELAEFSEDGE